MKLKLYSLFLLFFFGIVHAQQLNCIVNVNSDQITLTNKQIFNTLEKSLSDFINKTDWTGITYKQEEKINCSMYITVTAFDSNQFTATIQVQSSRPIYNSTYSSPILNFNDKDFSFKYNEFENLNFNPTNFESNLVSVISFYSFVIIGLDADTYSVIGKKIIIGIRELIVNNTSSNYILQYWIEKRRVHALGKVLLVGAGEQRAVLMSDAAGRRLRGHEVSFSQSKSLFHMLKKTSFQH